MAGKRARIKDHILRGDMTEEEAKDLASKGFKNRNQYYTLPEKSILPLIPSALPEDEKEPKALVIKKRG